MKQTTLVDRESSFKFVIGFALAVAFLVAVALPASGLATFYEQLDTLSDSVRRGDFGEAEGNITDITAFYESSRTWGVGWVVDAFLFRDAFLQQASYNYLTGDYDAVVSNLADRVDDPRASFLLGSAKFQLARQEYRAIPAQDPDAAQLRDAVVQYVFDDVNGDFQRAVRTDTEERFDYAWNYDLTSDIEAIRRALEPLREIDPPELEQIKGEGTPVRRRRG